MTAIESLWALYSDGQRSEKMAGLYPNRPSYIFCPSQCFYNREQNAVRGFEISGKIRFKKPQYSLPGQLAIPRVICLSQEHKGPDASTCPQVVIFSSAPGGQLFSQEPGWALSVGSESKALTYTFLTRLITIYLKLKFSNS